MQILVNSNIKEQEVIEKEFNFQLNDLLIKIFLFTDKNFHSLLPNGVELLNGNCGFTLES